MSKTLVLIDDALAFRQYFALERTGMKNSQNQPTWAVYGFFKAIFDLLSRIKPDSIAVAFMFRIILSELKCMMDIKQTVKLCLILCPLKWLSLWKV